MERAVGKKLSEMTLKELWRLFPIRLTSHKPYWGDWYTEEVQSLKRILPAEARYHHIGSTAINGIMAKPIIDVLIEVDSVELLEKAANILVENDYIIMARSITRISLNKGYTENGFAEKVFHLHIRLTGDTDEIYFRDYLNAHPDIAKAYERLKLRLWKEYEHDRDGYTNAKTDFVTEYTRLAKLKLNRRYFTFSRFVHPRRFPSRIDNNRDKAYNS